MPDDWGSRVGEDLSPDTWTECVQLILGSGGGETLYRGHESFAWRLESSLERALRTYAERWDERKHELMLSMSADPETEEWADSVERSLTERFRRNALRFGVPDLPEPWDILGWWEVMQHHGAPTRLIDWTRSPFIAIWFALQGDSEESGDVAVEGDSEELGDMALWIYDRRNARVNHLGAEKELREASDILMLDDRQFQNRFVRLAIADGNPALIPVEPRQFPRAVAQQSALTVSPSISVGRPAHWWIREELATRIRLRSHWRPDMLAACASLGFSRPGLFRDLDSLGDYVSESFRDRSEFIDPT